MLAQKQQQRREQRAIATLAAIYKAEAAAVNSDPESTIPLTPYLDLDELVRRHLVSDELARGERKGYRYVVAHVAYFDRDNNLPIDSYYMLATPENEGDRYFYARSDGLLYQSTVPIPVDPKTGQMVKSPTGESVAGSSSGHTVTDYVRRYGLSAD
jgi:hypothetical protein